MLLTDPFPGRASPLFWAAFTLGAYWHFRKHDPHDIQSHLDFNALAIAATTLMTTNMTARCVAVAGGILQLYDSRPCDTLGFLMQAGALGFSIRASQLAQTGTLPRPYRR